MSAYLRRHVSGILFGFVALGIAFMLVRGLVGAPAYTDAYYHFNAAQRLATGEGLTDTYLWTYFGAPESYNDSRPFPSHLYWMPLTSILSGVSMGLLGNSYAAAQIPLVLCVAGAAGVAYKLGFRLGGTRRTAWCAGLIALFGGFFARFWGTIDTFAPIAVIGALGLYFLGHGLDTLKQASPVARISFWLLAGGMAGLAHLTRPDGLLLLLTGWAVLFWMLLRHRLWGKSLLAGLLLTIGYLVMMGFWFFRNLDAINAVLPTGGLQSVWFTEYNDLFNYPPAASFNDFWGSGGLGFFISTRWQAFAGGDGLLSGNLGTFIAIEGIVVMAPLMLIGLWRRRKQPFLAPFWVYALGLHVAMTLVFPFPGARGGLFHGAAALWPWWAALGVLGCEDMVRWVAKRRKSWNPRVAIPIFTFSLVGFAIFLSLTIGTRGIVLPTTAVPAFYAELDAALPDGARVLINDPAALYYFTGRGGAAVPNSDPDVIRELAERYDLDYVVFEYRGLPTPILNAWDNPPAFLMPMEFNQPEAKLYAIVR